MVEMRDAAGESVLGGRSRDRCVMLDVDGSNLPVKWQGVTEPVPVGTRVTLRIFWRDGIIFAVGSDRGLAGARGRGPATGASTGLLHNAGTGLL